MTFLDERESSQDGQPMETGSQALDQRWFDLGVAAVIVALLAIIVFIAWDKYWQLHHKYVTVPAQAKKKLADELAAKAKREQERQKAERADEEKALAVLTKAGFAFHSRNVEANGQLMVNGAGEPYRVKTDLLVTKEGQVYAVEMKSGSPATSIRHGATRRQLLEYSVIFPVAGTLLVDLKGKTFQHIVFPNYKVDPKPIVHLDRRARMLTLIVGVWLGAGLALTLPRASRVIRTRLGEAASQVMIRVLD